MPSPQQRSTSGRMTGGEMDAVFNVIPWTKTSWDAAVAASTNFATSTFSFGGVPWSSQIAGLVPSSCFIFKTFLKAGRYKFLCLENPDS